MWKRKIIINKRERTQDETQKKGKTEELQGKEEREIKILNWSQWRRAAISGETEQKRPTRNTKINTPSIHASR